MALINDYLDTSDDVLPAVFLCCTSCNLMSVTPRLLPFCSCAEYISVSCLVCIAKKKKKEYGE